MRAAIISLLIISSLYCISATSDPYNGAYWLRNTEVGLGNYEPGYFGMNVPGPYSWTPFSGNFGLYDIEGVINEGGNLVSGGGFYNYVVQVDDDDEGDDDQFPQTLEDPFQILYQVGQLNEYHGAARDFFPDGSGRTFIFKQDCYLTPFTQETLCENYFFTEDGLPFDQGKNFYVQLYRDYDVGFGNNDVIVTDIGTPQVKVFQIELSDDDDAGQGAGIIIDAATTVGCTYNGWSFGNCCEALKPNTFSFDGSALADGNVCSGYGGIYIRDRDIFHFPTANAYGCGDYSGDYLVGMQVTANPGASTLSFQSREAMIWGYKDTNTYSRSHGSIIFEDTFDFTDTLDVPESDIITEVEVSLLLQHTWISDLVIDVTSPSGTNVVLFNSDCGSSDHIFETFADGGGDICVDANPAAPLEPLSTFNGEDQQGTWTLHINDSVGGDSGEINDWFIRINGENYRGSIPGLPIDDSAPTVSSIDVTDNFIIVDTFVTFDMPHSFVGDLEVTLQSPTGTIINLLDNQCDSTVNIFETFADGGGDICVDANPAAPLEPLSTFNGEDQQGTWTLHINDSVGGDSGEINDWFIRINGENYRGSIPGLPIDDSAPTVSSIDVTDNFIIVDTFVTFDMPHSFVGDLEVTLQSPTGTIINLLDNQCDSTVNIFETFADGGGDICVDANPAAPLEPLSTFAGENAFGTWELIITDNLEGDSGTLNYWQLDFHPNACGNGVREATEQCDTIDHGLETCQSIAGLPHGQLSCRHDCTFDVSHCSAETFIRTTPGKNVLVMDTSYLYDDDDTVDGIGSIVQAERANLFTYRNNGYSNDREFLENNLCGVDLLIANFLEVTEESVENVRNFVSLGGSVFITGNTYYADEDDYNGELFGISRYYNDYSWSGNETPHIVKNIASGMTTGLIDMRGRDSALGFGYSDDDISIEILAFGFGDSGISVVDLEDDYCNNYIAGNYCSVSAFQRIGDGYMYFNGASFSDSKQYSTQQFFSSNSFIRNTIYNARGIAPKPFQFDDRPITLGIDFRNFADYCEGASVSLYRDGVLINTFTNPNGIARYVDNLTGCFDYSLTYNAPGGSFFQQTQQLETFNFCGREVFEQQNFIKPNRNLSFLDCSNPDSRFERNLCDSVNNTA
eukprot:TRINITY_DN84_c0_g1_i1.p1 TRINITY_DN84_c0_g1~~TRINITY_DN84_c0_g1_i1.p1  ORF type:complete len:1135 (+),score=482.18 TRINITY_DN84_c0_g1_i1:299-3703(+)